MYYQKFKSFKQPVTENHEDITKLINRIIKNRKSLKKL